MLECLSSLHVLNNFRREKQQKHNLRVKKLWRNKLNDTFDGILLIESLQMLNPSYVKKFKISTNMTSTSQKKKIIT